MSNLESILKKGVRKVSLNAGLGLAALGFFGQGNIACGQSEPDGLVRVNLSFNNSLDSSVSHYVLYTSQDGSNFIPMDEIDFYGTQLNRIPATNWVNGVSFVEVKAEPWQVFQYRVTAVGLYDVASDPCDAIEVDYSLFRYNFEDRSPPVLILDPYNPSVKEGHATLSGFAYDEENPINGGVKLSGDFKNLKLEKNESGYWSWSFDLTKKDACVKVIARNNVGLQTIEDICFQYDDSELPQVSFSSSPNAVLGEGQGILESSLIKLAAERESVPRIYVLDRNVTLLGQVSDNNLVAGISISGDAEVLPSDWNFADQTAIAGRTAVTPDGVWKGDFHGGQWYAPIQLSKEGTNYVSINALDGAENLKSTLVEIVTDCIDSDGDGIKDLHETYVYGTNPMKRDSDGDGMSDLEEITFGFNPLEPSDSLRLDSYIFASIDETNYLRLDFRVKDNFAYRLEERENLDIASTWKGIADFRTEVFYEFPEPRVPEIINEYDEFGNWLYDNYDYWREPIEKCTVAMYNLTNPDIKFNQTPVNEPFYSQHTHPVSVYIPAENGIRLYRLGMGME